MHNNRKHAPACQIPCAFNCGEQPLFASQHNNNWVARSRRWRKVLRTPCTLPGTGTRQRHRHYTQCIIYYLKIMVGALRQITCIGKRLGGRAGAWVTRQAIWKITVPVPLLNCIVGSLKREFENWSPGFDLILFFLLFLVVYRALYGILMKPFANGFIHTRDIGEEV